MSPIPRDISPELVLVDPELAAFARQRLPEPGRSLGRQHLAALESDAGALVAATDRNDSTPERGGGWGMTLLLTVGAVSLTLNGFWLAQIVGSGASSSAQPAYQAPLASVVLANDQTRSSPATSLANPARSTVATTKRVITRVQTVAAPKRAHSLPPGDRVSSGRAGGGVASTGGHRQVIQSKRRATETARRTIVARSSQDLQWDAVPSATYYNVVLWRDGRRILDLWPVSPRIVLPTAYVDHGSQVRLSPGRYLWFVYPGFGPKSAREYGALAGSGVVVIRPEGGNEG
jgi:hypothetical protein